MLKTRHILPILFGTLLLTAACQKIDDSAFNNGSKGTSTEESGSESSGNNNNSNQGNGAESNPNSKTPVTQEDGTQWLQVDKHVTILQDGNEALLVSLTEWNNISYSADASIHTQAINIAKSYKEGDLTGWRLPTLEEGKELYSKYKRSTDTDYNDSLGVLNTKITDLGGIPINAWQAKDKYPAFRYLCSGKDTTYSFSLKAGSSTSKVGKTVKYNLRLVKDTTINIQ